MRYIKTVDFHYNKKRILIIDDNKSVLEMLKDSLEYKGYEVETAVSGEEGLKKAFSFMPKVILLDLDMPKMTGFDVLSKLKEDYRTRDILVYIITVQDERENLDKGFLMGAKEYMVKPFSVDSLNDLLKTSFAV